MMAFKEAMRLLLERRTSTSTTTVKSETTKLLIIQLHQKHGITNEKRKLTKSTLYKAVATGFADKSPKKKGPALRIPNELMEAVAHAKASQVSGAGGELRGCNLKRLIGAATVGTQ